MVFKKNYDMSYINNICYYFILKVCSSIYNTALFVEKVTAYIQTKRSNLLFIKNCY